MFDPLSLSAGRRNALLTLACFAAFMAMFDMNIVRLAMPAISHHFHVDSSVVAWVQVLYILVLTCLLLVFGKLGDVLGYRRIFLGGLVVFTVGSLLSALSEQAESIGWLLGARALQAAGGAAMTALTTPLVSTFLPSASKGLALGIVSACESLGITLGRYLGGVIVEYLSWPWIFLINVPVGVAAFVLALWAMPQYTPGRKEKGFDAGGAVLLALTLGPLLFGINMGGAFGWTDPFILGAFALAAAGGWGFVFRERRVAAPLLDLSIFNPNLALAFVTSLVKFFIESGLYYLVPFFLMLEKEPHMTAEEAGLLLMIPALVQMAICLFTGRLSDLVGARLLGLISMLVTSLSCLLFALLTAHTQLWFIVAALSTIGLSKGLFIAPNRHRIMDSAPTDKMASVNAALETTTRAGVALGVCSFEAVFSSHLSQRGADYLHAPESVLESGFRAAFLMGLAVSAIGVLAAGIRVPSRKENEAGKANS